MYVSKRTCAAGMQGLFEMLTELHRCPASEHWADFLSDRSMSRTRRMMASVLQLFAARCCLEEAFKGGQETIMATFRQNNVTYSQASTAGPLAGTGSDNIHSDSGPDGNVSGKHQILSRKEKKRKRKSKSEKHRSKRRHKNRSSDNDNDEIFEIGAGAAPSWQVSFEGYFGECTEFDAAECLCMLAACIRMEAWWTFLKG